MNGNGDDGDYSCDRIACPAGTFSPTGRGGGGGGGYGGRYGFGGGGADAASSSCIPCLDADALTLGRKSCENYNHDDATNSAMGEMPGSVNAVSDTAVLALLLSLFLIGALITMAMKRQVSLAEEEGRGYSRL